MSKRNSTIEIIEGSKFKFQTFTEKLWRPRPPAPNGLLPMALICWVQQVSEFSHIVFILNFTFLDISFKQTADGDLFKLTDQKMLTTPCCTMHYASSFPFWVFLEPGTCSTSGAL